MRRGRRCRRYGCIRRPLLCIFYRLTLTLSNDLAVTLRCLRRGRSSACSCLVGVVGDCGLREMHHGRLSAHVVCHLDRSNLVGENIAKLLDVLVDVGSRSERKPDADTTCNREHNTTKSRREAGVSRAAASALSTLHAVLVDEKTTQPELVAGSLQDRQSVVTQLVSGTQRLERQHFLQHLRQKLLSQVCHLSHILVSCDSRVCCPERSSAFRVAEPTFQPANSRVFI